MESKWIERARDGDEESIGLIRHRLRERLRLYAALQLGPLLRLAHDPDAIAERAVDRVFELLPDHPVGERGLVYATSRIIDAQVDALECGVELTGIAHSESRRWIPPAGLRAIEDLRQLERDALVAKLVLGLRLEDVADRMGQTERTAERLIGSARRKLREHGFPIERITQSFHTR